MWRYLGFSIIAITLSSGCAGGSVSKPEIPPLEPVSGTVKLDGKPEAGISVIFSPAANNKGNASYGTTDEAGAFKMVYREGHEGVPAGDYVVMFSKLTQKDGSPIPPGQTAADVQAVDKIPQQYRMNENPRYTVTVPAGGKSDFAWDLKTK